MMRPPHFARPDTAGHRSNRVDSAEVPAPQLQADALPGLEALEPRLLLSGTINAAFVAVDNSSALTGYKTYDIRVTSDADWTTAYLFIELDRGSIYQDPAGTERQPNGQLLNVFPTLEFDTYLSANGNPVSLLAGANEIGGSAIQFDNTGISISWFDSATNDIGDSVIGRVTLSDDAAGSLGLRVFESTHVSHGDGVGTFTTWDTFSSGDLINLTPAAPRPETPITPPPPTGPLDHTARFVEVDNSSALNGYRTFDLEITTGNDWTSTALLIELTGGSFYQDPYGSDLEPPSGLFGTYPKLEFDTYVTTYGNSASIAGGAGDVGGDGLQFDTQEIDISWFDIPRNDVGTFSIGRFTLTDDAAGSFKFLTFSGNPHRIFASDTFRHGNLGAQVFTPPGKPAPKLPPPPPPPGPMLAEFVAVDNGDSIAGYKTFDLVVSTDTDWSSASLSIDLQRGSIYQDPAGTELAPNPVTFQAFPAIEFDTYITANGDLTSVGGGGGGGAMLFDNSRIDVTWSGLGTDDVGTVVIGRITLSEDAVGSVSLEVKADRNELRDSGMFELGDLENLKPPPTPPAAAAADFTGDGRADILWWDSQTGRNSVWEMNRTSFVSSIDLPAFVSKDWEAVGTGDLTGDGMADILWRHSRNGKNMVTRMDGTEVQEKIDIKRVRNRAWKVGGIGDFTGDGKADILWRHTRNGRNSVWEMDGTSFVEGIALKTVKSLDWNIAGVSDLTGDGKADILWRNSRNGKNSLWEMDGTDQLSNNKINALKSQNWQVAGVGDYTGDGLADILWRDTKHGKNRVWEMDGTTFSRLLTVQTQADRDLQAAGTLLGMWE